MRNVQTHSANWWSNQITQKERRTIISILYWHLKNDPYHCKCFQCFHTVQQLQHWLHSLHDSYFCRSFFFLPSYTMHKFNSVSHSTKTFIVDAFIRHSVIIMQSQVPSCAMLVWWMTRLEILQPSVHRNSIFICV